MNTVTPRRGKRSASCPGRRSALHDDASQCILSALPLMDGDDEWACVLRSPEPADTRGVSCCACSRAPRDRDRRADRGHQRRARRSARTSRTCAPLADRVLARDHRRDAWPATTSSSSPCRTGSPPPSPSSSATTCWSSTAAPTSGSTTPADWEQLLRRRRTPAPGRTACPSCPAQRERAARRPGASRCPAATRPPSPWRCSPPYAARPGRARGRGRRRHRHLAARARSLKPHLLGSEVMGSMSAVRRRRRPPAHPRDRSRTSRPRPGEPVTRLLHPDPRPDEPRHPRHLHAPRPSPASPRRRCASRVREGLRRRAVRPPAARGRSGPPPPLRYGSNTAAAPGRPRRARRPGHRRQRHRQPHQGHRGGAVQSTNIALGLPEELGPSSTIGVAP